MQWQLPLVVTICDNTRWYLRRLRLPYNCIESFTAVRNNGPNKEHEEGFKRGVRPLRPPLRPFVPQDRVIKPRSSCKIQAQSDIPSTGTVSWGWKRLVLQKSWFLQGEKRVIIDQRVGGVGRLPSPPEPNRSTAKGGNFDPDKEIIDDWTEEVDEEQCEQVFVGCRALEGDGDDQN